MQKNFITKLLEFVKIKMVYSWNKKTKEVIHYKGESQKLK